VSRGNWWQRAPGDRLQSHNRRLATSAHPSPPFTHPRPAHNPCSPHGTADSWGTNDIRYDYLAQQVDRYSWEIPEFLPVFPAGNEGQLMTSGQRLSGASAFAGGSSATVPLPPLPGMMLRRLLMPPLPLLVARGAGCCPNAEACGPAMSPASPRR
jgi:hypothetical protein